MTKRIIATKARNELGSGDNKECSAHMHLTLLPDATPGMMPHACALPVSNDENNTVRAITPGALPLRTRTAIERRIEHVRTRAVAILPWLTSSALSCRSPARTRNRNRTSPSCMLCLLTGAEWAARSSAADQLSRSVAVRHSRPCRSTNINTASHKRSRTNT